MRGPGLAATDYRVYASSEERRSMAFVLVLGMEGVLGRFV